MEAQSDLFDPPVEPCVEAKSSSTSQDTLSPGYFRFLWSLLLERGLDSTKPIELKSTRFYTAKRLDPKGERRPFFPLRRLLGAPRDRGGREHEKPKKRTSNGEWARVSPFGGLGFQKARLGSVTWLFFATESFCKISGMFSKRCQNRLD